MKTTNKKNLYYIVQIVYDDDSSKFASYGYDEDEHTDSIDEACEFTNVNDADAVAREIIAQEPKTIISILMYYR